MKTKSAVARVDMFVGGKRVIELGPQEKSGSAGIIMTVKYAGGTYGVIHQGYATNPRFEPWISSTPEVAQAIRESVGMPTVQRSVASSLYNVFGEDKSGVYVAKLYCNDKAEGGVRDRLIRK